MLHSRPAPCPDRKTTDGFGGAGGTRLAAVGTWSAKLLLLELPSMRVVHSADLGEGMLPRSALFLPAAMGPVLMLGMGDGQLVHWRVRLRMQMRVHRP